MGATIRSTIELYDRVSAPISKMITSTSRLCGAFERIQSSMDKSFNADEIQMARQELGEAAIEMMTIGQNIGKNTNEQRKFNNTVNQGSNAMSGLARKATGLVSVYAMLRGAKEVINLSDEYTQTTARLNLMTSSLEKTRVLQQQIFESAQRSRTEYMATADVIAKLGQRAPDAFSSSEETIAFAETLNKMFVIAGASQQEISSASLQLTQALGSGVLRGEELNAVFEAAPNVIQAVADYMDVPIGQIRNMASEGRITAEIVKNAMLSAADSTDKAFQKIPMTWSQVWTMAQNNMIMGLEPVLQKLNEMANSESFQGFVSMATNTVATLGVAFLTILEGIGAIANFAYEHLSFLVPVILTVVTAFAVYNAVLAISSAISGIWATATGIATAAQGGFNAALMACPLTWIILAIAILIGLIYAFAAHIAHASGVASSGFGLIAGCINVVIHMFINLLMVGVSVLNGIYQAGCACGYNMQTAFNNSIANIQTFFYNLASYALGVIADIAAALSALPFVEFDAAGLSSKAGAYAQKAHDLQASKGKYKDVGDAFNKGMDQFKAFEKGWDKNAFNAGAKWGDGIMGKFKGGKGFSMPKMPAMPGGLGGTKMPAMPKMPAGLGGGKGGKGLGESIPKNISDIAGNTGKIAGSMEITKEELKYLRDIAERDVINRFTTAKIKVDMGGVTNNVSSETDLDGIINYLADGVNEAMQVAAEGV